MSKELAQIQKQIAKLEQQANELKKKEARDVIARIKEAIAFYGLTPSDLGFSAGKTRKAGVSKAAGGGAKSRGKGSVGRIKFRDEQGNTWTGHGRRPQWFLDAIAAGKTPEQLSV